MKALVSSNEKSRAFRKYSDLLDDEILALLNYSFEMIRDDKERGTNSSRWNRPSLWSLQLIKEIRKPWQFSRNTRWTAALEEDRWADPLSLFEGRNYDNWHSINLLIIVSSLRRVPSPPAKITAFIYLFSHTKLD